MVTSKEALTSRCATFVKLCNICDMFYPIHYYLHGLSQALGCMWTEGSAHESQCKGHIGKVFSLLTRSTYYIIIIIIIIISIIILATSSCSLSLFSSCSLIRDSLNIHHMRMHHSQISVLKIIMYNTIHSFLAIDARTHTCEDCYVHTNNTIMYGGG